MDPFDRLNHLTQPRVEELPQLEHQPPGIDTRYAVKSEGPASVSGSRQQVQTKIWFKSPVGFLNSMHDAFPYIDVVNRVLLATNRPNNPHDSRD